MLSEREQNIWDDIEHNSLTEADGRREEVPAVVVGGSWGAVLLVLFGVPSAGVAVGAAAGLIWLLWRFFPQLDRTLATDVESSPPPARSPATRWPVASVGEANARCRGGSGVPVCAPRRAPPTGADPAGHPHQPERVPRQADALSRLQEEN